MKQQTGLTLIEIIIAFVILSVAFMAIAFSQFVGLKVSADSVEASIAKDLASQKMEEIRGFGFSVYSGCPSQNPSVKQAPDCTGKISSIPNHKDFAMTWSISNDPKTVKNISVNPDPTSPSLLSIDLVVYWEQESYAISSYLSCADVGEFSNTSIPCPSDSLLSNGGLPK